MIARVLAATLMLFAASATAEAQPSPQTTPRPLPQPPRVFPADKFSTKPVQGGGEAASPSPDLKGVNEPQKDRWEERSRTR